MSNLIKYLVLTVLVQVSHFADADECRLGAHFGPVTFDNERPVAALRQILKGTGISLIESGEFDAGTISARNVSGTVGEAVQRLAEGTNLSYTCNNGVMRVSQKPRPSNVALPELVSPVAATAPLPQLSAPKARPAISSIKISSGDSIRARLTQFAKANQYQVSWTGDDLFAKKDASFTGDNFEDVINKFFIATKITGYITKDEGRMLNVFVQ
ncbi:MAG TPA: hypothetical protein VFN66_03670 [Burkholderiales bacterium]|nr:hypothetical protein [Burkholderiales bacterium]